eukprot:5306287-Amphidinium_carterae.1
MGTIMYTTHRRARRKVATWTFDQHVWINPTSLGLLLVEATWHDFTSRACSAHSHNASRSARYTVITRSQGRAVS